MLSIRESLQIQRLKVKGWKTILHAKRNRKRAGLGILISNKIEFKSKEVIRDKEKYIYILMKGSIQQDIKIINIYKPNDRYQNTVFLQYL